MRDSPNFVERVPTLILDVDPDKLGYVDSVE